MIGRLDTFYLDTMFLWLTAGNTEEEYDEDDADGEDTEAEEAMKHDQLTAFLEQMEQQYRK